MTPWTPHGLFALVLLGVGSYPTEGQRSEVQLPPFPPDVPADAFAEPPARRSRAVRAVRRLA